MRLSVIVAVGLLCVMLGVVFLRLSSPRGAPPPVAMAHEESGPPAPKPSAPRFSESLPRGMRAVTLELDAVSAVVGYVSSGDHVDVLFTRSHDAKEPPLAETLLENVRVLADERANPQLTLHARESAPSAVTLALSPEDAEKIRLAEKSGTLSLALRPAEEMEAAAPAPVTLPDIAPTTPPAALPQEVVIVRGAGAYGVQK